MIYLASNGLSNALIHFDTSHNINVMNLMFKGCIFYLNRAINILSSAFINIQNLTILDSIVDYNNLIYLSQVKDLSISNVSVSNITITQPSMYNYILISHYYLFRFCSCTLCWSFAALDWERSFLQLHKLDLQLKSNLFLHIK